MKTKIKNSKFELLRLDLKNEIIEYLPVIFVFKHCLPLNKKFFSLINRNKIIIKIKKEIKEIEENSIQLKNLLYKQTKSLKIKLKNLNFEKKTINEIVAYLICIFIKRKNNIELFDSTDKILTKEINRFWNSDKILQKDKFNSKVIFRVISSKSNLKELNFNRNFLSNKSTIFKNFCESIKLNENLEKIYLTNNEIGTLFCEFNQINLLNKALQANIKLKFLNLENNEIGIYKDDGFYVSEIIRQNINLEYFNLNKNNLGTYKNDCKVIFEALKESKYINEFYLSRNLLGKDKNDKDIIIDNIIQIYHKIEIYIFNNKFLLQDIKEIELSIQNKLNIKII